MVETTPGPIQNRQRPLRLGGIVPLLAFVLLGLCGCAQALFLPFLMVKGTDRDPEFKKEIKAVPKESTVVVICRSPYLNLFGSDNPSRALSLMLTKRLAQNIDKKKKLNWVTIDRVEAVFDETGYAHESFEKMGAKVNADYVVGVDLDSFDIHHSTQFYQGKAKINVRFVKVATGEVVFAKTLPLFVYPPNAPPSVNDISADDFQNIFVIKLAGEIGTLFYPHNPHERFAMDNDFSRLR